MAADGHGWPLLASGCLTDGLPNCPSYQVPDCPSQQVRRDGGIVGSRRQLPEDVALKLKAKWATIVQPQTGCADYAALRERLRLGQ